MSTTSQVTDWSDLYTDLQNRVRVATGVTATENQAKRYLNIALQDLLANFSEKMPWLERRAELVTHAPYSDGTVTISVGSTTLTGTSTLWNTANSYNQNNMRTQGKLTIAGGHDLYRISAVTTDTSATSVTRYVASNNASGVTYVYFEDEYDLASDFLRPLDFTMFINSYQIPIISRREFIRAYPRPNVSGRPRVATLLDLPPVSNTTPIRRIQFYPYPDTTYIISYRYVTANLVTGSDGTAKAQFTAAADEPLLPLRYRHVLVLGALANWYRDKRDDARSQEAKAEYIDLAGRMVADTEIGTSNSIQIQPRPGLYSKHARTPYGRIGYRYGR